MTEKILKIAGADGEARVVRTYSDMVKPPVTLGKGAMDSATAGSVQLAPEYEYPDRFRAFLGYGALQDLSQDAMIRLMVETRTQEMLRRWIEFQKSEDTELIDGIESEIERVHLKDTLEKTLNIMGYYGGAYLFIDTGAKSENLVDPLNFDVESGEVRQDRPLHFRVIEPIFTTPVSFNSNDPFKADFYKPEVFMVLGVKVHKSRLIRFVENEVSDYLKPAYNFLGIPQAQILQDYVRDFNSNREAVNRLLKKFSTSFLKTQLSSVLYNGEAWEQVDRRVKNFVRYRNNDGVALLDNETEDFLQVNTPIAGLNDILAQSLQMVVAINHTNVVTTLGQSPAGFNTGDSDIKVHNNLIASLQARVLRRPLDIIFRCLQLHKFGTAKALPFDFRPLSEDDENMIAQTRKTNADTDAVYIDRGVISEDEARNRLKNDKNGGYSDLEGDAPGLPEDDGMGGLNGFGGNEEGQNDDADKAGEIF